MKKQTLEDCVGDQTCPHAGAATGGVPGQYYSAAAAATATAASGGGGLAGSTSANNLLLRPAENSPFVMRNVAERGSSTNSTPYSQISVPSSYDDYEDDFTSEDDVAAEDSDGSIIFDRKNK